MANKIAKISTKVKRRQKKRGVVEIKGTSGGEYTLNGKEYRGIII